MAAPGDDYDRGLEGDLHGLTDEQWLAGHRALVADDSIPNSELAYLWEPGRDPATVTVDDLREVPDGQLP